MIKIKDKRINYISVLIFVLIFILRMPIPMGMMTACVFYFLGTGESPKMVAQQTLAEYSPQSRG